MRKTTHSASVASDGFHSASSNSPSARPLSGLIRLVGLALYMVDPFRGAFDPLLVTDYASYASSAPG